MRLTRYLAEGRSQTISMEDAWKLIETKHSNAYKSAQAGVGQMFRGINYNEAPGEGVAYIEPRKFVRKSANTTNWYTQIISNSKLWKKYPRRDKSIICTTSPATASAYGEGYLVLPQNKGRIGICPEDDFWDSFGDFAPDHVNYSLETLITDIMAADDIRNSVDVHPLDAQKNVKDMYKLFTAMTKFFKDPPVGVVIDLTNSLTPDDVAMPIQLPSAFSDFKPGGDFRNYIETKFQPERHGFKVTKAGLGLPPNSGVGQEVWTDAPSLLIQTHDVKGFDIRING